MKSLDKRKIILDTITLSRQCQIMTLLCSGGGFGEEYVMSAESSESVCVHWSHPGMGPESEDSCTRAPGTGCKGSQQEG